MDRASMTAIAMYERALAVFARRAGSSGVLPSATVDEELARWAESLALPGDRIPEENGPPLLASIMGRVLGGNKPGYYLPAIISNQSVIPQQERPRDIEELYARLWARFVQERERLVTQDQPIKLQERNLHALLHRYTWAMAAPRLQSDAQDSTLVSLFDYARTSAAIAVCLEERTHDEESVALLIGGDLSGVQEWLYRFSSRGAAKSLRGRSFYLQLLTEVIALYLLDELALPMANLLYAGGGNFYILAPTNRAMKVQELGREIGRKLLRMHGGDLYVALTSTPVGANMMYGDAEHHIGQVWQVVSQQLNRAKAQRFADLDTDEMATAIGSALQGTGLLEDTCAVCRRTIGPNEKGVRLDPEGTEQAAARKCDLCVSFEALGSQLPEAEFLVLARIADETPDVVTDWQQGLRQFHYDVQLVGNAADNGRSWKDRSGEFVHIFYWKQDPDISEFPGWPGAERTVWAFRPLAQCTPRMHNGDIATFDQLESDGIRRWGVLRMDVDNLGKIFQQGIPANNLSRVVGVSGLLRLFFEGYVPFIADAINEDRGGRRLYLMYAGGDDLFVVGGWSDLPRLAHAIRTEFARFSCGNAKVTISGGITIALDDHYPLYQAARAASEAEDLAKDHGKNALAFLGQAVKWGEEYERVANRVQTLKTWLQEDSARLPRSFLMTLRAIVAEWDTWKKQEAGKQPRYTHQDQEIYLGPWQWRLVYSLTRAAERTGDPSLQDEVLQWIASILAGEIKTLGLTSRWAELLTRKPQETA